MDSDKKVECNGKDHDQAASVVQSVSAAPGSIATDKAPEVNNQDELKRLSLFASQESGLEVLSHSSAGGEGAQKLECGGECSSILLDEADLESFLASDDVDAVSAQEQVVNVQEVDAVSSEELPSWLQTAYEAVFPDPHVELAQEKAAHHQTCAKLAERDVQLAQEKEAHHQTSAKLAEREAQLHQIRAELSAVRKVSVFPSGHVTFLQEFYEGYSSALFRLSRVNSNLFEENARLSQENARLSQENTGSGLKKLLRRQ